MWYSTSRVSSDVLPPPPPPHGLLPNLWQHDWQLLPRLDRKFSATETVTIGQTGIQTSLLAMGTGTVGSGHHSHQTALGLEGLSRLLQNGYDNGLRFFDTADSYGSHPHVADALKHVDRSKVTVLTKSWARTAPEMRADLDRFRRELGHGLSGYLPDALRDGSGLDHAFSAGDGRACPKPSRRESFARTVAPAIRSKRCGRRRNRRGWKWTWSASTPSVRTWMPIPKPSCP